MRPFAHSLARTFGATLLRALAAPVAGPIPSFAQRTADTLQAPFLKLRSRTGSDTPNEMFDDERSGLGADWSRGRKVDLCALATIAEAAPPFVRAKRLLVDKATTAHSATLLETVNVGVTDAAPAIYVHCYYISFERAAATPYYCSRKPGLRGASCGSAGLRTGRRTIAPMTKPT